mgnify:CR=1 FL=1
MRVNSSVCRRLSVVLATLLLGLLILRLWPHAPLREAAPLSRLVLAENGELLRMTLASDGQYRLWLPLERIAPAMIDALLLKEDRHFYRHPGVTQGLNRCVHLIDLCAFQCYFTARDGCGANRFKPGDCDSGATRRGRCSAAAARPRGERAGQ